MNYEEFIPLIIPLLGVALGAFLRVLTEIIELRKKVPPEYLPFLDIVMTFLSLFLSGGIALLFASTFTKGVVLLTGIGGVAGYFGMKFMAKFGKFIFETLDMAFDVIEEYIKKKLNKTLK